MALFFTEYSILLGGVCVDVSIWVIVANMTVLLGAIIFSFYISKRTRNNEGWAVGGRALPVYVVILTQFATASGGGMLVAQVGIGYAFGWSVITYGLFTGAGVLALLFLAKWLRKNDFISLPDIFKKIYGTHPFLITTITFMTMVVPFGWLCTQLVAFGRLFSELTGVEPWLLMLIFTVICLLFIIPGGLVSVAWTDLIFGILMLVMAVVASVYAITSAGGWSAIVQAVPQENIGIEGFWSVGLLTVLFWSLSLTPGTMTNQMYFQRIYAADSMKTVVISLLSTAALLILTKFYAALVGMSAYTMNPNLDNPESAAGMFLSNMPSILMVAYSTFICATLLSTVTSAVQSVVVNITRDIYQSYLNPNVSDGQLLRTSRIFSVFVIFFAFALATLYPRALDWIVASYAYSAAGLFAPLFIGFALKDRQFLTFKGAIAGMLFGIAGAGLAHLLGTTIPYVAFGLLASTIGLLIVSAATRNKKTAAVARKETSI